MNERQELREFILENIEPIEELSFSGKIAIGTTVAASLLGIAALVRKKLLTNKFIKALSKDSVGRRYVTQIKKDTEENQEFGERIFYLYDRLEKGKELSLQERDRIKKEIKRMEKEAKIESQSEDKLRNDAIVHYEKITGEKYKGWKSMAI